MSDKKENKQKKEYGTIPVKLILSQDQLDGCTKAAMAADSQEECISKVGAVLNEKEEDILSKGYEPDYLSFIIGTALYPAVAKIKKESNVPLKLDEDT